MPIATDSRGVTIFLSDDQARAEAQALVDRAEQTLDYQDQRGYPLNDSDAARVELDLVEAARLLQDVGDYKAVYSAVNSLKRFTQPGESERVLAERADAEERRRALARRMAQTAFLVDQLGAEDDPDVTPSNVDNSQVEPPDPPRKTASMKLDRERNLYVVEGRGPRIEFSSWQEADRELRSRRPFRA